MELMFPIHGTSSTLYVSTLEMFQICTLHFVMNKVLISIIWLYSFSPLCFNLHVRSPSIAILHNDLQYEIAERFSPKSPNNFSKSPTTISPNKFLQISKAIAKRFSPKSPNDFSKSLTTISPNKFLQISKASAKRFSPKSPNGFLQNRRTVSPKHRQSFTENRRIRVLQITGHISSKSPTYLATRFLETAEHSILNLQDILLISDQPIFFYVLFGEDPVSDPSLHVPWAPRSTLWVVGCGCLVMPFSPTRARALRSTLWVTG